ncbi:hypothetical protein GJU40_01255 [Bacillus lacus]|uniref:Histidine kinase n=1 Tax=Metabacillus lacus TaxID=1983721 RepID=A0A7X2LYD7_9BACI|nr:hypothetical protein [Metabacillus lacus]MRX70792.1 hypothetical protein [Metabacillus lacus]
MENILVCIKNQKHAELLINRGKQLASAFKGKCVLLHVDLYEEEEKDYQHEYLLDILLHTAAKFNLSLQCVPAKHRKLAAVIAETAAKERIKQIVIGQPILSKWDFLTKGSIVSDLFSVLEGVDLHIVEITSDKADEEIPYQRGIPAYLEKDGEEFTLTLDRPLSYLKKGIFYKENSTDFNTGFLQVEVEKKPVFLKVKEGTVDKEESEKLNRNI